MEFVNSVCSWCCGRRSIQANEKRSQSNREGIKLYMSQNRIEHPVISNDRLNEIGAILAITKTAKNGARELGLNFEVYLLDMSVIALSERLDKEAKKVDHL